MDVFPSGMQSSYRVLSAWKNNPFRANVVYSVLKISIELITKQNNLVDAGLYILIDIYETRTRRSRSKPAALNFEYAISAEGRPTKIGKFYHPDWLTIDQLEWFIERVPTIGATI
jgi:hypothetical protein